MQRARRIRAYHSDPAPHVGHASASVSLMCRFQFNNWYVEGIHGRRAHIYRRKRVALSLVLPGMASHGCCRKAPSLLTATCPHHVTAAAIGIRTGPVVVRLPRLLPRAKHTFHLTMPYDKASHRAGSLGPTAKVWGVFSQTTRKSFGFQR